MKIKAFSGFSLLCFAAYFVESLSLLDLPGVRGDYMALGFLTLALAYWVRAREAKTA